MLRDWEGCSSLPISCAWAHQGVSRWTSWFEVSESAPGPSICLLFTSNCHSIQGRDLAEGRFAFAAAEHIQSRTEQKQLTNGLASCSQKNVNTCDKTDIAAERGSGPGPARTDTGLNLRFLFGSGMA